MENCTLAVNQEYILLFTLLYRSGYRRDFLPCLWQWVPVLSPSSRI